MAEWLIAPVLKTELPHGELAAPTNDINTTVALALLTSVAYFYAGLNKRGLNYFGKYIQPTPILLPINILEDFTKPLSLSFRLFGNILADELVVVVLVSLVPSVVPIPVMFLGLFTSGIQALIFATLAAAYIGESMEDESFIYGSKRGILTYLNKVYDWFEERLEIQAIADDITSKYVPPHVNIFYCLGGITLTCFLVQVATGFAMTFYYRPTVTEAFASVQYIMTEANFGWLIRSVHRWSASMMVLMMILHVFRVYLTGGFKKPLLLNGAATNS
ncbi:hypothetical protein CASFOL_009539 [Castilleja foliolosa]|uniref:ATP synthase subunit a, chloroplastic n=1 Tax=Castilleja foliolosa TaxID=1961234 RepID=A0ABD3DWY6_9LAMI